MAIDDTELERVRKSGVHELLEFLSPYVKNHKGWFFGLNITAIIAAIAQTYIPLTVGRVIDTVLVTLDKGSLRDAFFLLVGLVVLDLFAQSAQRFAGVQFAQRVIFDIRQNLFIKLQNQEMDFYSKETTGQIMARSVEEVYSLRDILTWAYRITVLVTFLFIGAIGSMFLLGVESFSSGNYGPFYLSAAYMIIPVVIYKIVTSSSARNRQIFYNTRQKYGEMSEVMAENLSGIHTVKSFGREQEQIQIFNVKNQEFYEASLKGAKVRGQMQPGIIFIIGSALIFLVFIGGYLVSIDSITAGNFIAFMLLALQIAVPGRFVGWVGIIAQDANSAAIRLNEIFEVEVSITNEPDATKLEHVSGEVTFENVSFAYPGSNHTLHNINLKIRQGEKIALLGQTGAGKSTLINLIPRLFDPSEGRVLIDSHDVKTQTLRSLRKHIGIVHQDAFLFTMTIHDNIAFGRPYASREEVIAAAKAAQIHDFIMTLEEDYETIVGERGVTLSGGQRQRVTIARVLLQNPEILIFDDSVSAVDPQTEAYIMQNLEEASKNRTTIIISQRASSLKFVDRIVVLDDGHIVQNGTHADLINQTGIYRDFINAVNTQVKFMDWSQEKIEMEGEN
ncbi:MAG: ABC transporter ATP-binding protein [Candidatus Kariarchaeaceae archaeon]